VLNRSADAGAPLPALPRGLIVAVLAAAFCALARGVSAGDPLLLWPAAGVAFAFGWRHGLLWTLPAAAGALAYGIVVHREPGLAIAAAAVTAAGPAASLALLRWLSSWKPAQHRVEAVLRFVTTTLLLTAPIGALLGAVALFASGALPTAPILALFLGTWLALALGTLLVAPAVLAWIDEAAPGAERDEPGSPFFDVPGVLLAVALAGASLLLAAVAEARYAQLLTFLYFPIAVWSALRMNERAHALTLPLASLPLLGAAAWSASAGAASGGWAIESAVLVLCATLVALVLQAVASDRRLALLRMARQARQDLSTGLLNDRGLLAEFGDRLASPQRPNQGLIGIHLPNLEAISDLCGPIAAMQLEQSAAGLMQRQPGAALAARLSAGRYALVVRADTIAQVRSVARDLYAHLAGQLFATEHGSLRLKVCVGGLLIDRHALINGEDCLASLSDAMAIAASVRDPQLFVEPLSQMMIDSRRGHQAKIEHIREAIRESRLELYGQPVTDRTAPPGMVSYEILTRLLDRDGSLIQPAEFLTLTLQAQMSVPFDRAVVRKTFEWLASHPLALARTHRCSINLTGATMSDGAIAEFIRQQRSLLDIPAERIVFEITESEAIRNPSAASRLLDDLKSQGFGIALDDFGTGLATFEYLRRFPLDYVKIDGSFIRNLTSNPIDEEIVMSTVRMARRLNLRTVAEHVHSEGVFERLREMGVDSLQGDLFGRPQPIDTLFGAFAGFGEREPAVRDESPGAARSLVPQAAALAADTAAGKAPDPLRPGAPAGN